MAPFDEPPLDQSLPPSLHDQTGPDGFKDVLAGLAGGVAIVTGWEQARPHGLLVSSITGLSLQPPRFLFCVRKEASSHAAFLANDVCGVIILSREDKAEAQTFIHPALKERRFKSDAWRLEGALPPLFNGGLSSTACAVTSRIDAGSHTIFIVTAQGFSVRDGEPLVSFNRALRRLSSSDDL